MKRCYLILWALAAINLTVPAQNKINRYEFWFDANFEGREFVDVTPVSALQLVTSIPTIGLLGGLHSFHLRFRDDSAKYSPAICQFFCKIPAGTSSNKNIVAYEYWYDNNYAGKVFQPVTPQSGTQVIGGISAISLADGLHSFNIHFKDDQNGWSSVLSQFFHKIPAGTSSNKNIVAYEYWYDNNYAGKVFQPVTPQSGTQVIGGISAISLADGSHSFNIRFKDDQNGWSSVLSQFFHKIPEGTSSNKNIVAYEYWYDNNFAGRVSQPVTPQSGTQVIAGIPANSLADGLHSFNIRFKDDRNGWSSSLSQFFHKIPAGSSLIKKIIEYEYWYDNDYAGKVTQSLAQQSGIELITSISASSLADGMHLFHIRFKDNLNSWSGAQSHFFQRISNPGGTTNKLDAYRYWFDLADSSMVTLNLPVPVNPYEMVQDLYVGNLPIGEHSVHFQFKDITGQWSSTISTQFDFTGPPGERTITTQTISNGQTACFDALQTITVAGNGSTFTVENGGIATMIAGLKISYLSGTTVQSGGYMWGYITSDGQYCGTKASSIPAVLTSAENPTMIEEKSSFKVYPNPTTGNFILELTRDISAGKVTVDAYGMWGEMVLTTTLKGEVRHEFSLSDRPAGVYFIRVITGDKSETAKIIKQ